MLTRRNLLQNGAAAGLLSVAGPVFATVAPSQPRINPGLLNRARQALQAKRPLLRLVK